MSSAHSLKGPPIHFRGLTDWVKEGTCAGVCVRACAYAEEGAGGGCVWLFTSARHEELEKRCCTSCLIAHLMPAARQWRSILWPKGKGRRRKRRQGAGLTWTGAPPREKRTKEEQRWCAARAAHPHGLRPSHAILYTHTYTYVHPCFLSHEPMHARAVWRRGRVSVEETRPFKEGEGRREKCAVSVRWLAEHGCSCTAGGIERCELWHAERQQTHTDTHTFTTFFSSAVWSV